jgi:CRP/FNR family transcriptional regulator, polysaccharide utilization system transcription regulator
MIKARTILVIEDNDDVRENTAEILGLAGYNVLQAANGRRGVELAQQSRPDLIVCDIMMPVLDGYGVIHLLGKNPVTASIPFIFLTAKSERADFRKGMDLGADDYITKPFDDVELLKAVESRLKKSESIREEYSKSEEGFDAFISDARKITDLKELADDRRRRSYRKKELIYREGDAPVFLYFLTKGKVALSRAHDYGKELITTLVKEGEFFGYTALFDESEYTESAEALDDSEVSLIPKEDFFAIIHGNIAVMKSFVRLLSGNVLEMERQLVNQAYSSVRKRVAGALILLHDRYARKGESKFSISVSRDDLANIVGTATESLIRALSDFKEEKLVEIKGSNISILDVGKLKRMKA